MTPKELEHTEVADSYAKLQRDILNELIKRLKEASLIGLDKDNAMIWQIEQLAETDKLLRELIPAIAKQLNVNDAQLQEFLISSGKELLEDTTKTLEKTLKKEHKPVSTDTQALLDAYQVQTFRDINNTVNQSLLTTNYSQNSVAIAYQEMAKKTAISVMTGYQTPEQAIKSVSMEWAKKGLTSPLIDKGGHSWSIETYSRMLINNTVHRTANELRLQRAKDYGITTAVMNSHPAAREACAYIQGTVVNTVPEGTEGYDSRFDTIYNHGYGKPAGTLGINCTHTLTPFDPDTMTNPYKKYDPDKAIANAEIKAKQRQLERSIRESKKMLDTAEKLGDDNLIAKYRSQVRGKQKKIREHIDNHDFLGRDYSRERVFNSIDPKTAAKRQMDFMSKGGYVNKPVDKFGNIPEQTKWFNMNTVNSTVSNVPALRKFYKTNDKQLGVQFEADSFLQHPRAIGVVQTKNTDLVRLNSAFFKSERETKDYVLKGIINKDFVNVPHKHLKAYPVVHETGHILHNVLWYNERKHNKEITFDEFLENEMNSIFDLYEKRTGRPYRDEYLPSSYAKKNRKEAFAELFTAMTLGYSSTWKAVMSEYVKKRR